ncbi:MAG: hypothetical protein K6E41_03160 [Solobacterium sp.]|nr:hypothetical protein [Solobacterium sp.]
MLMVWIVCTVHLRPSVDLSHSISQIEEMVQNSTPIITKKYFTQNPNNIPLTILLYRVYSPVRAVFGTSVSLEQTGGLLNVFMIETAIICLFRLIERIDAPSFSRWSVKWIILLNPVWIAYAPYYYTDTISLPFAAAGLLVLIISLQNTIPLKRTALCYLSGLLLFAAMKIRVTFILLILSVLIGLMYRRKRRDFLKTTVVLLLSFLSVQFVYQRLEDVHMQMDTYDTALPATHFMMMGSHGDGKYSYDDCVYTLSFSTHEEKVRHTWKAYLDHLKQNGIPGNIKLIVKKEIVVWCSGTRGYDQYTEHVRDETRLYHVFYGNCSGWFKGLMQSYQILLFVCIALGLRKYRSGTSDLFLLIMVFWCSTILFSVIWEAHARHALSYIPFLTFLCLPAFQKNNV